MPQKSETITTRIIVSGFVQGVNYRRWLQGEALSRGISGRVCNRADGTVEALLKGDARAVDDLARACRHGPALARVDKVHAEPAAYDGPDGFEIGAPE